MANYTKEKSKYGGMVGTIQIFASQLPTTNSPNAPEFKSLIPAGFLRCDGSILEATDYPELAKIIGVGSGCRYKKDSITLNSGQFQLPDLGSKYMVASNAGGLYNNLFLQDEKTYHVGSEFNISSNVLGTETINYTGKFVIEGPNTGTKLLGNPLYKTGNKKTEEASLSDAHFQGHGHSGNQTVLNYTGNYQISPSTGKSSTTLGHSGDNCTCLGGNVYELTSSYGTDASLHSHDITMPTSAGHSHNFTWTYNTFNVGVDNLVTTVNIIISKAHTTFDDTQSPFIIVEYIIKY